jgi:hypothetical protein
MEIAGRQNHVGALAEGVRLIAGIMGTMHTESGGTAKPSQVLRLLATKFESSEKAGEAVERLLSLIGTAKAPPSGGLN